MMTDVERYIEHVRSGIRMDEFDMFLSMIGSKLMYIDNVKYMLFNGLRKYSDSVSNINKIINHPDIVRFITKMQHLNIDINKLENIFNATLDTLKYVFVYDIDQESSMVSAIITQFIKEVEEKLISEKLM